MEESRTVFLVDDEDYIRRALGLLFRRNRFTVEEASTGDEAVAMIELHVHGALHAVLTDFSMPQGSKTGLDVATAAVRAGVNRVAIMTGGHGNLLDVDKLAKRGIWVFEKPVESQALLDWLQEESS